ncbi:NAD(P)H-binding protein [Actinospica sp. MGRD01-02]|uniref:NAD(P)H-binding protein n=1 Tax=Actinospica acidithermotolerans TaxID=2828514 RepID=A0A941IL06_9ACTN|nr:NAD(P)H-binding protein [Actinospica acidithermotolerans]MBR7829497.1 NAD(P)H-binding protein [Actinospica acidithermotolerans]
MRIVIAGGHGQIALRLSRILHARGDEPVGLIRHAEQAQDLRAAGAAPVVLDLETASGAPEVAEALKGADAVVFAAGAGPGSGAARKDTVDRAAAVLLADAAELAGVRRYLMISSMGADANSEFDGDPVFRAYLRAKGAADDDLRARPGLDWTVLRPGSLRNDPGTGRVLLAERTGRGAVPRDDVAEVLAALLAQPSTAGLTLELIGGVTPIPEAVAAFA